jgi:hypothetical protein
MGPGVRIFPARPEVVNRPQETATPAALGKAPGASVVLIGQACHGGALPVNHVLFSLRPTDTPLKFKERGLGGSSLFYAMAAIFL